MSFPNLNVGTLVKGRYQILAELGEGGFAKVFKAEDIELKRTVALKVVKMTPGGSAQELERFRREAKVLAQLQHKNIVSVYAIDLLEDLSPFIVMEFLSGKSLQKLLIENKTLDYSECREIFSQVCAGLSYAHQLGVLHRDLSPANVFLIDDSISSVKIIDFGLARLVADGESGNLTLTQTGTVVGNPAYMSPEQSRGEKLDARSDIYSLGCIMYESACGKAPFECWNPIGLMQLQQSEYPQAPVLEWNNRNLASKFSDIILKCMQKDKSKRFQTCDEVRESLLDDSGSDQDFVRGADPWRGTRPVRQRNLRFLLPLAIVSVFLALFFAFGPQLTVSLLKSMHSDSLLDLKEWTARQLRGRSPMEASILYEDLLSFEKVKNDCGRYRNICLDQADCRRRAGEFSSVIALVDSASNCSSAISGEDEFLKKSQRLLDMVVDKNSVPTDKEMLLRAKLLDIALSLKKKALIRSGFDSVQQRTTRLIPQMYLHASPEDKQALSEVLRVTCAALKIYPQLAQVESTVGQFQGLISYTMISTPVHAEYGAKLAQILLSIVKDPKTCGELKLLRVDNLRVVDPGLAYKLAQDYLENDSEICALHRFHMSIKAAEMATELGKKDEAVKLFSAAEEIYSIEQFPSVVGFETGVGLYWSEWKSYQSEPSQRQHCLKGMFSMLSKTNELKSPSAVLSLDRGTRKMKTGNAALEDQRTHEGFREACEVFIDAKEFEKADAFLKVYLQMLKASGVSVQRGDLMEKWKDDATIAPGTRELIVKILACQK